MYPAQYVTLVGQFNDTGGSAAAATGVTFDVYYPNGGTPAAYAHGQTAAVLDSKTGCYFIAFALPAYDADYVGLWTWRVTGTCDSETPAASGEFEYQAAPLAAGAAMTLTEAYDAAKAAAAPGAEMDLVDAPNATAVTAIQSGLAVPGDEMDLVDAPNATAVTAIQSGLAVPGDEMDLVDAPNATAITAIQAGLAVPGDEMDLVDTPNPTALNAGADALLNRAGFTAAGTMTVKAILTALLAMAKGKISKSGDAYTFYDDDGATPVFTLTLGASTRTPS